MMRTIYILLLINIPENVEHLHGASAGQDMSHVAITDYLGEENVVRLNW